MTIKKFFDSNRIYAVVIPSVRTPIGKTLVMEKGRQAAQACHAVSKIKLQFVNTQKNKANWYKAFEKQGMTTIILQARDQRELTHIQELAEAKGLMQCDFFDENEALYGKGVFVKTAIAIGPTCRDKVMGVCDYLPLFE